MQKNRSSRELCADDRRNAGKAAHAQQGIRSSGSEETQGFAGASGDAGKKFERTFEGMGHPRQYLRFYSGFPGDHGLPFGIDSGEQKQYISALTFELFCDGEPGVEVSTGSSAGNKEGLYLHCPGVPFQ